ncbi:MAG: hypothetical protein QXV58_14865 [Saccharolobus sp.]|uniref:hypothetical protein n=1 Tax=Saccharolobus sp. TaxID=2100761 RepID=UPI0031636B85
MYTQIAEMLTFLVSIYMLASLILEYQHTKSIENQTRYFAQLLTLNIQASHNAEILRINKSDKS